MARYLVWLIKPRPFTCVGWQVTLCAPIWQVTSRIVVRWNSTNSYTLLYLFYRWPMTWPTTHCYCVLSAIPIQCCTDKYSTYNFKIEKFFINKIISTKCCLVFNAGDHFNYSRLACSLISKHKYEILDKFDRLSHGSMDHGHWPIRPTWPIQICWPIWHMTHWSDVSPASAAQHTAERWRRRDSTVELSRVGGVNAPVCSRDPCSLQFPVLLSHLDWWQVTT